jgi:hypothetical protein
MLLWRVKFTIPRYDQRRSQSAEQKPKTRERYRKCPWANRTTTGSLTLAKFGKIRKAKVHAAQNADETTPQAAKALGSYPDRNHKQLQTVDANPQNSKPT